MNPSPSIFRIPLSTASSAAGRYDALMLAMVIMLAIAAIGLLFTTIWLCVRYRATSAADRRDAPVSGRALELAWFLTPLLLFLGAFAWAAIDFAALHRPPPGAMPVFVVAKQWMWKLEHQNGRREINELHVPVGQPVRLLMASQDVIHSFYVPAFRLKADVVPGRYTSLWFTPTEPGEYRLFCAEYCGTDHAGMLGRVVVMPPAAFARWLEAGDVQSSLAAQGAALFRRHGCSGCHDAGSTVRAPDLAGLFGRPVALQDGRTVIADEAYLRDAMLLPARDVAAGYAPLMPSFAGQLSEEDVLALIAYIRSLGDADAHANPPAHAGP